MEEDGLEQVSLPSVNFNRDDSGGPQYEVPERDIINGKTHYPSSPSKKEWRKKVDPMQGHITVNKRILLQIQSRRNLKQEGIR